MAARVIRAEPIGNLCSPAVSLAIHSKIVGFGIFTSRFPWTEALVEGLRAPKLRRQVERVATLAVHVPWPKDKKGFRRGTKGYRIPPRDAWLQLCSGLMKKKALNNYLFIRSCRNIDLLVKQPNTTFRFERKNYT